LSLGLVLNGVDSRIRTRPNIRIRQLEIEGVQRGSLNFGMMKKKPSYNLEDPASGLQFEKEIRAPNLTDISGSRDVIQRHRTVQFFHF